MQIQACACLILLAGMLIVTGVRADAAADLRTPGGNLSTYDEVDEGQLARGFAPEEIGRAGLNHPEPTPCSGGPGGGIMLIGEPRTIWGLMLGFLLLRVRPGTHSR